MVAAVREVRAEALVVIVVTELVIESTRVSWSLVRLTVSVRPLSVGCTLSVVVRRLTVVSSRIWPALPSSPPSRTTRYRNASAAMSPAIPPSVTVMRASLASGRRPIARVTASPAAQAAPEPGPALLQPRLEAAVGGPVVVAAAGEVVGQVLLYRNGIRLVVGVDV